MYSVKLYVVIYICHSVIHYGAQRSKNPHYGGRRGDHDAGCARAQHDAAGCKQAYRPFGAGCWRGALQARGEILKHYPGMSLFPGL